MPRRGQPGRSWGFAAGLRGWVAAGLTTPLGQPGRHRLGADLTGPGDRPAHIAHSPDGDEERKEKRELQTRRRRAVVMWAGRRRACASGAGWERPVHISTAPRP